MVAEAATFDQWAHRTPPDFVMAVKASRYLTHVLRLADPEEPVKLLVERAGHLGEKLGPILVQLPPSLHLEIDRLERTLEAFPPDWRVAVEFRHRSWFNDKVRKVLEDHNAALCLADRRGPVAPLWRTTDWTYLRFHIGQSTPRPCYGQAALETWLERLKACWSFNEDVFVYFNNDHRACALRDARLFALAGRRDGWVTTRTPDADEIRLGEYRLFETLASVPKRGYSRIDLARRQDHAAALSPHWSQRGDGSMKRFVQGILIAAASSILLISAAMPVSATSPDVYTGAVGGPTSIPGDNIFHLVGGILVPPGTWWVTGTAVVDGGGNGTLGTGQTTCQMFGNDGSFTYRLDQSTWALVGHAEGRAVANAYLTSVTTMTSGWNLDFKCLSDSQSISVSDLELSAVKVSSSSSPMFIADGAQSASIAGNSSFHTVGGLSVPKGKRFLVAKANIVNQSSSQTTNEICQLKLARPISTRAARACTTQRSRVTKERPPFRLPTLSRRVATLRFNAKARSR